MASSLSINNLLPEITWLNASKASTLLLAGHMLHIGLWAYTSPAGLCKAFGMRLDGRAYTTTKAPDNQEDNFWPMLFAPREVGFAALIFGFAALGDWRAVGVVVAVVGGVVATGDGVAAGLFWKGGWMEASKSRGFPAVLLGAVAAVVLKGC